MDEIEILEFLRKEAWEDLEWLSNSKKAERERWVVSEFLSALGLKAEGSEIRSPEQDSKVDVTYLDASFQIKEITDPNIQRGKMYKDTYNAYKGATSLEKVSWNVIVQDVAPISNMYELVIAHSKELAQSEKYAGCKNELDLLFYITRTRAALIKENEIKSEDFAHFGWRSISCINSKQAAILFATPQSPYFIYNKINKVVKNNG